MYKFSGNHHQIVIDNQTFWVDSNQEETLIRWLEENGFHKRWYHPELGMNVGRSNYTPDLELSVQLGGMTHRAIVESKPTLKHFNSYISRRMRGVAKYYFTDLLLLYVHDINSWYRIDIDTGRLSSFGIPVPGEYPIAKLYTPFSKRAPNIHYHHYRQRLALGKTIILAVMDNIESGLREVFGAKKTKRRYRRKR